MPAGRSAVAQCHFCCPSISSVVTLGERYTGGTVTGYAAFDDGTYNPSNPTAWPYYGVLFRVCHRTRFIDSGFATCGCGTGIGYGNQYNETSYIPIDGTAECFRIRTPRYTETPSFECITEAAVEEGCSAFAVFCGSSVVIGDCTPTTSQRKIGPTCCDDSIGGGTYEEITNLSLSEGPIPSGGTGPIYGMYEYSFVESPTVTSNTIVAPCGLDQPQSASVNLGGYTKAKREYTVLGAPLTSYNVEISFLHLGPLSFSETIKIELTVTTDDDGVSVWQMFNPMPVAGGSITLTSMKIV